MTHPLPSKEVPVFKVPAAKRAERLPLCKPEDARWKTTIRYRTSTGLDNMFTAHLAEIGDLHDIVERGPHYDCVISIDVIRVNHSESKTLTVEEAREL